MHIYKPGIWSTKITVDPASEPVTLTELKESLRILPPNSDDDNELNACIASATHMVEGLLNRALMSQTRTLELDRFPPGRDYAIELPGGYVQSVSSITYTDADGNPQTLASGLYTVDLGSKRGTSRVMINSTASDGWPLTQSNNPLPVLITYVAGWPNAAAIPDDIKRGVRACAASLFGNPEAEAAKGMEESLWWRSFVAQWRIRPLT